MWNCVKCRESVEDTFEICWNCGTAKDGTEDATFSREDEAASEVDEIVGPQINCLRCHHQLTFVGLKRFHEGTRAFDVLGGLWELFENREHFDVYVCPKCGRVELFVEGIGQQFRHR